MANRITQVAEEALVQGTPNARVTQIAEEALVSGTPKARVTQIAFEVLQTTAAAPTARARVQAIIIG